MIELRNINFKEYFELEDHSEYDFAIKYSYDFLKAVDIFNVGDLMKQSFGLIKDLQTDLSGLTWEQYFDYVVKMTKKDIKEIVEYKLIELCQFKCYIVEEIQRITEIESKVLGHTTTAEEKNAGIEELNELGYYLQLRSLACEDITKIDKVKELQYELCFTELVAQKRIFEYQERLYKLKSKAK